MSYDLVFWDGPKPAGQPAAQAKLAELGDLLDDEGHQPGPATPGITALVTRLEARWPMTDEGTAPWASWPLGGIDADGPTLWVNLTFEGARHVEEMAVLARELGITCLDPQADDVV